MLNRLYAPPPHTHTHTHTHTFHLEQLNSKFFSQGFNKTIPHTHMCRCTNRGLYSSYLTVDVINIDIFAERARKKEKIPGSSWYLNLRHLVEEQYLYYRSLTKKRLWAEHLTSFSKRGVGALPSVSAFNHERAPMSCLRRLDVLKPNNWTNNNVQRNNQWPLR